MNYLFKCHKTLNLAFLFSALLPNLLQSTHNKRKQNSSKVKMVKVNL